MSQESTCVGTERGWSVLEGQSGHAHLPGGSWSPSSRHRLGDGPVHSWGSWEGSALTKHSEGSPGKWERASLSMLVLVTNRPKDRAAESEAPTGSSVPRGRMPPCLAGSPPLKRNN